MKEITVCSTSRRENSEWCRSHDLLWGNGLSNNTKIIWYSDAYKHFPDIDIGPFPMPN